MKKLKCKPWLLAEISTFCFSLQHKKPMKKKVIKAHVNHRVCWKAPSVGYSLLTVTLTVWGARAQERRCSFINVKEQDTVTERQALMVTDKNCQIHFIHPAVTQRQPSLGIRDRKREKGKSPDILQTFRVQETWLQNPKTRSRFTARDT